MFWLSLPSLGESWHHNHHAFPRSAAHGLRWWEIDVSAAVIKLMDKVDTPKRAFQVLREHLQVHHLRPEPPHVITGTPDIAKTQG